MIIISQDREEIVNFNRVTNMYALNGGDIRCMLSSGDDTFIAKYKTKERAKEVLQDIVDRYDYLETVKTGAYKLDISEENFKYEMPLE